jgi:hypothetical protein
VLALVATTVAQASPTGATTRATVVAADHPDIRYQGRWGRLGDAIATVNSGSGVMMRFTGQHIAATFDQSTVTHPPQIYVRIDRGATVLYAVDRNLIDLTAMR